MVMIPFHMPKAEKADRTRTSKTTKAGAAALRRELMVESERCESELCAADAVELDLRLELGLLADPKQLIEQLDERIPFVLLPLRIETRFKTSPRGGHQLWIRAFPDDCQVQTYTDFITDTELSNVRHFWIDWYKAGGHVDQQRAAWRAWSWHMAPAAHHF